MLASAMHFLFWFLFLFFCFCSISRHYNITEFIYYRPRSRRDNTFGSVRVSVRLSVGALLFEPFDLWP